MARSMRNAATRRAAPNVEQSLHLLVEPVVCQEDSFVEPRLALDTLNLGHADLRNECSGTSAIVSSTFRTGLAAPRLRRPPRTPTPLHQSRPSQRAEARFILDNG